MERIIYEVSFLQSPLLSSQLGKYENRLEISRKLGTEGIGTHIYPWKNSRASKINLISIEKTNNINIIVSFGVS